MMIDDAMETELLAMIRERIVDQFQPIRLILFGSRARGDARADSNIDLLVVLPVVTDKRRAAVEMRRALQDLPVGKDIIVTSPEEIERRGGFVGSILRSALRDGSTIFEQSGTSRRSPSMASLCPGRPGLRRRNDAAVVGGSPASVLARPAGSREGRQRRARLPRHRFSKGAHDLDLLRRLIPDDWRLKSTPADLAELSEWSVEARYPGDWPEATLADAQRAVTLALEVVQIVTEDVAQLGLTVMPK